MFVVKYLHSISSGLSHTRSHLSLTVLEVNEATNRLQFIIASASSAPEDKMSPVQTCAHIFRPPEASDE